MANRLMSSFSRKPENMDVERGKIQSAEEDSIRSADQIPEIKVDQSQERKRENRPQPISPARIVPEQSNPLGKSPYARNSLDAKKQEAKTLIKPQEPFEAKRDGNVLFGNLLAMTPAKEFVFLPSEGESQDVLSLYNPSKNEAVAYKMQTTSPDGYRVVPHSGIIDSRQQADVVISLLPEHRHAADEDKFLLTTMTLSDKRVKQGLRSKSLWMMPLTGGEARTEHRFTCHVIDEEDCSCEDPGDTNIFHGVGETVPLKIPSGNKEQKRFNEKIEKSACLLFCFILGTLLLVTVMALSAVVAYSFGARIPQQLLLTTPLSATTDVTTRNHNNHTMDRQPI